MTLTLTSAVQRKGRRSPSANVNVNVKVNVSRPRSRSRRRQRQRPEVKVNVNVILAGQIRGEPHDLYMVYPQGNPLRASAESPFLQIGECKYGRPILDRGIKHDRTSLEEASKYALLSMDSTMKSNVTVGPPIDVLVYATDELDVTRHRRFAAVRHTLTTKRRTHSGRRFVISTTIVTCRILSCRPSLS